MNKKNLVISHSWSPLVQAISAQDPLDFTPFTVAQFADKEVSVALKEPEKVAQRDVLLIYQISHKQSAGSINDQIVSALALVHLIKNLGAQSIKLMFPYLPYGRQDMTSDKKHFGSVYMLGTCLKALGVYDVHAFDMHEPSVITNFPLSLRNLTLDDFWSKIIENQIIKNDDKKSYCIVSPDEGGRVRAKNIAHVLGIMSAYIHKKRTATDEAQAYELFGDVQGKKIILIDDIIDTGNTALSACQLLSKQGAATISGCFTHGVLSGDAIKKLAQSSFEQVFITNTVADIDMSGSRKIVIVPIVIDQVMVSF